MSSPNYFELGGVVLPLNAGLTIDQSYEDLSATTYPPIRMANGDAKVQTAWGAKLKTVINGKGWRGSPFDGLDFTQPLLMRCTAPKTIASASNAISLPSARRTDSYFLPHGYAVVNGVDVDSPVSMAGDTATVTVVAGASSYGVHYYPELTVYAQHSTGAALFGAEFDWQIQAEEI
jgi:hypothetical protein